MADVEINDLTLKATADSSDELELQETGGGSSRKTTMAGLRITESQITDRLAPAYGYLYEDNDSGSVISITYLGVYYGWVTATEGYVDGGGYVTADVADGTADHLTIASPPGGTGAGKYTASLAVSLEGEVSAEIEGALFVNGVESEIELQLKMANPAAVASSACFGILDLSLADEVSFRVTSDGNGHEVTIYRCQLVLNRIDE